MQLCLFFTFLVVTGTFSKSADGSSLPRGHSQDPRGRRAPGDGLREEDVRGGASENGISPAAGARGGGRSGQLSSTLTADNLIQNKDNSNSFASPTKSSSSSPSSQSSLLLSPSSVPSSVAPSSSSPSSKSEPSSPSEVVYATVTRGVSPQRPSLLSSLTAHAHAHSRAKRSLYRRSATALGSEERQATAERAGSSRQKHAWKRRKFNAASEADSPAARNTSPWSSASSNSFLNSYSRSQGSSSSSRQSHTQAQQQQQQYNHHHHSRSSDASPSADSASIDSFKMSDFSPDFFDYEGLEAAPGLPVAAALTSPAGSRPNSGAPAAASEKGPSPAEAFDAAGRSLARNLMVRTPRSGRRYDVPQIGKYEAYRRYKGNDI